MPKTIPPHTEQSMLDDNERSEIIRESTGERAFAEITEAIVARMKEATSSSTDSDLARALEVSPQVIYNARKRRRIPSSWIFSVSTKYGISADWLIYGEQTKRNLYSKKLIEKEGVEPPKYSEDVIKMSVLAVEEVAVRSGKNIAPEQKANLVTMFCFSLGAIENHHQLDEAKDRTMQVFKNMLIESLSLPDDEYLPLDKHLEKYFANPQGYLDKKKK